MDQKQGYTFILTEITKIQGFFFISCIIMFKAFIHLDLVSFDIPWSIILDFVVHILAVISLSDNIDYSSSWNGYDTVDNLRDVR